MISRSTKSILVPGVCCWLANSPLHHWKMSGRVSVEYGPRRLRSKTTPTHVSHSLLQLPVRHGQTHVCRQPCVHQSAHQEARPLHKFGGLWIHMKERGSLNCCSLKWKGTYVYNYVICIYQICHVQGKHRNLDLFFSRFPGSVFVLNWITNSSRQSGLRACCVCSAHKSLASAHFFCSVALQIPRSGQLWRRTSLRENKKSSALQTSSVLSSSSPNLQTRWLRPRCGLDPANGVWCLPLHFLQSFDETWVPFQLRGKLLISEKKKT